MNGVSVAVPPQGAFYVLPDVSGYFSGDDTELCLELLKQKKLALVPGSSFGAPGTVRISYATSMEELQVAMNKLGRVSPGTRECTIIVFSMLARLFVNVKSSIASIVKFSVLLKSA